MLSKYSRSRLARPRTSFMPINSSREAFRIDRIVLSFLGRTWGVPFGTRRLAALCRWFDKPRRCVSRKRLPCRPKLTSLDIPGIVQGLSNPAAKRAFPSPSRPKRDAPSPTEEG